MSVNTGSDWEFFRIEYNARKTCRAILHAICGVAETWIFHKLIIVLCTGCSQAAEDHADQGAGTAWLRSGNPSLLQM